MNAEQLSVRDAVVRLKALEDGERVTLLAEFADAFGPLLTRTLRARKPKYEAELMNRLLTAAVAIFGSEQHTMDVLRRTRFFSKTSKPQRRYCATFWSFSLWALNVAGRTCVCVHCVAVQCGEYGGASAVSGSAAGSVSSHSGHSFLHQRHEQVAVGARPSAAQQRDEHRRPAITSAHQSRVWRQRSIGRAGGQDHGTSRAQHRRVSGPFGRHTIGTIVRTGGRCQLRDARAVLNAHLKALVALGMLRITATNAPDRVLLCDPFGVVHLTHTQTDVTMYWRMTDDSATLARFAQYQMPMFSVSLQLIDDADVFYRSFSNLITRPQLLLLAFERELTGSARYYGPALRTAVDAVAAAPIVIAIDDHHVRARAACRHSLRVTRVSLTHHSRMRRRRSSLPLTTTTYERVLSLRVRCCSHVSLACRSRVTRACVVAAGLACDAQVHRRVR